MSLKHYGIPEGPGRLEPWAVALLCNAAQEAIAERLASLETLCDYRTGETIRHATADEACDSREAAEHDGGSGVIMIGGRSCYVL